jgi:hypothetical protein
MKTLTYPEALDEVARKHDFDSWAHVIKTYDYVGKWLQEAAELYARAKWEEACELQRNMCADDLPDPFIKSLVKNTPKPEFKP